MSTIAEKFRTVTNTETVGESYEALVRTLSITAKACKAHDARLDAATPAEQADFSIARACEDASAELCKDITVPTFSVEEFGQSAGMLQYAATCNARRRHDVVLFTPAEK